MPADGRISAGTAEMDESMVTGESRTVSRHPGDQVIAGTVSTDSGIRVEVTATGPRYATSRLVVDVALGACRDAVSGSGFPDAVTVSAGGRTVRGCGGPRLIELDQ